MPNADPILRPLSGVDEAQDGWLTSRSLPLLRVDLDPARVAGRWAMCEYRVTTDTSVVRASLHVRSADPRSPRTSHALPTDSSGRGRWIGHLPADLQELVFEPIDQPGRFRIEHFGLRPISLARVLRRAAVVSPSRAGQALFWHVARRRLRARYRLRDILADETTGSGGRPELAYAAWIRANDTFEEAELGLMLESVEASGHPPLISVLMPVYNPVPRDLEAAIASVEAQVYPHWELRVADDASTDAEVRRILDAAAARDSRIHVVYRPKNEHISAASNSALEKAAGHFTALMDHDDLLPAHALLFVAREIVYHPGADLIYSDEDKVDGAGRRYMPHFKSDWNEELFLTQNFINHLAVFRTDILRRIGGFRVGLEGSQDHDLILRFLDYTDESRIRHIPRVLYHWRNYRESSSFSEKSMGKAVAARRRALADMVERRGWNAEVVEGAMGANRLLRHLPDPPEVTVIVPTRDAAKLLAVTAQGVLASTDYPNLKLLIIDNGSSEPDTAALFSELQRDPRVDILDRPGPFNYSALNNDAVRQTDSEVICFLNNDIEVIDSDWLREMVSSLTDGVAAVGAKLLYPDGTVQHAGVVLGGGGVAGHAHPDRAGDDPGYFGRAVLPQYVSAVTAACMVIRRDAFLEVGGFDAQDLKIAFNDIDLCLRLRARGYKILFDPYAVLIHHESATRGLDSAPEKRARFEGECQVMLDRWGPQLRRDPYYNPNLDLEFGDFRLRGVDPMGPRRERHPPPS